MSPLRAPLTALVPMALLGAAWGLSAASVSCSGRSKVKLKFTCRTLGPAARGWGASWQGAGLQDGAAWTWVAGPGSWVGPAPHRMGLLSQRGGGVAPAPSVSALREPPLSEGRGHRGPLSFQTLREAGFGTRGVEGGAARVGT